MFMYIYIACMHCHLVLQFALKGNRIRVKFIKKINWICEDNNLLVNKHVCLWDFLLADIWILEILNFSDDFYFEKYSSPNIFIWEKIFLFFNEKSKVMRVFFGQKEGQKRLWEIGLFKIWWNIIKNIFYLLTSVKESFYFQQYICKSNGNSQLLRLGHSDSHNI